MRLGSQVKQLLVIEFGICDGRLWTVRVEFEVVAKLASFGVDGLWLGIGWCCLATVLGEACSVVQVSLPVGEFSLSFVSMITAAMSNEGHEN